MVKMMVGDDGDDADVIINDDGVDGDDGDEGDVIENGHTK